MTTTRRPAIAPERRLAAAALAAFLALFLIGTAAVRLTARVLDATVAPDVMTFVPKPNLSGPRLQQMLERLPWIAAQPEPLALVLGSSNMQVAHAPDVFDAELARRGVRLESWNLCLVGLCPDGLRRVAAETRGQLEAAKRTAEVSIICFTPYEATEATARHRGMLDNNLTIAAALAGPLDMAGVLWRAPEDGLKAFAYRLLGTDPAAPAVARVQLDLTPGTPGDLELGKRRVALEALVGHPFQEWRPEYRGEPRFRVSPAASAALDAFEEKLRAPEFDDADRRRHEARMDFVELHIDGRLGDEFVSAVRELSACSKRTCVALTPRNPHWVPSAAGRERVRAFLERVERETGARVIDLSDAPGIGLEDFRDLTHLNEATGRPKASTMLAAKVAELFTR